jgi:hypothetical protein
MISPAEGLTVLFTIVRARSSARSTPSRSAEEEAGSCCMKIRVSSPRSGYISRLV